MSSLRSVIQLALALPWLLGAGVGTGAGAPPNADEANAYAVQSGVNENFGTQWQAKLCVTTPTSKPAQPYVEFSFHGPITEMFGPLCYHYAGYNETCLPAGKRWLTPATTIRLIAPGQVPVELLHGYTLLVRFPWQSDKLYRYPFANATCHTTGSNTPNRTTSQVPHL